MWFWQVWFVVFMEGVVQLLSCEGYSVVYNFKCYYYDVFVVMSCMCQCGFLCDIVLYVVVKEICVYKVVLVFCSLYFYVMFINEMSESCQIYVMLYDIDFQVLDQLVQFVYMVEIVVGEGNVQILFLVVSFLQLNGV